MSGRGDIHTPWGKQTLPERCATVKDQCHSPRAAREADLDAPSIAPPGDGGVSNCVRISGLTVDPEALSDRAALFLKLIASHHRCSPSEAIERASAFYCEKTIGLQRLADLREGDGA